MIAGSSQPASREAARGGRYTAVAMILHWVMAVGIMSLLAIGLIMVHGALDPGTMFRLFQLHKSIGLTILLAALLRLVWRLTHRPPALPAAMPALERRLAQLGHLALYGEMLFLPLSGWALVSASVYAIPTVLYGVIPWPDLPYLPDLANKAGAERLLTSVHAYGAWLLMALLSLHLLAALRHRVILHDEVLDRMLPRSLASFRGRRSS